MRRRNVDRQAALIAVHLENHHALFTNPPFANCGVSEVRQLHGQIGLRANGFECLERLQCSIRNKFDDEVDVLGKSLVAMQVYRTPPTTT